MRDRVGLATDVYLPHRMPRGGRVPAILARTPYDMRGNAVWFAAIAQLFNDAGFAFVVQDTRGRFRSGGIGRPFANEAADGYDTVSWVVEQCWSSGVVGLFGESYVGFAAYAAAGTGHPAIRAIATRETATDVAGDWMRHQGVFRLQAMTSWAATTWSGPGCPQPEFPWRVRPLRALLPMALPGREAPALDEWATAGPGYRYWPDDRGWPDLIDRVNIPAHFASGWWDLFVRGQLRDSVRHASRSARDSQLVVTATDHAGRDWHDGPTPDPLRDLGALAMSLPSLLDSELRFFLCHLQERRDKPRSRVRWVLTHAGERECDQWPPPGSKPWRLYLADAERAAQGPEGGALSERPDAIPVRARWIHDPGNLVPSLDGDVTSGWFRRPDERRVQVRPDVLTFTSSALRRHVDLAGPVCATLLVTSTAPSTHVMAKLTDVYPDGPARLIAEGACFVRKPSEGTMTTIDLGQAGYRIRAGHRIRLEVASSAFPRYIWHPGTEADPWRARKAASARQTLKTNDSALVLTVLAP